MRTLFLLTVLFCLGLATPGRAQVSTGSYVGDGTAGRTITGLGLRPGVVVVKGDLDEFPVIRTRTMPVDLSRRLGSSELGTLPDAIQTLDSDGFTLGTHPSVNSPGQA